MVFLLIDDGIAMLVAVVSRLVLIKGSVNRREAPINGLHFIDELQGQGIQLKMMKNDLPEVKSKTRPSSKSWEIFNSSESQSLHEVVSSQDYPEL